MTVSVPTYEILYFFNQDEKMENAQNICHFN
jgi:hypothetical protein